MLVTSSSVSRPGTPSALPLSPFVCHSFCNTLQLAGGSMPSSHSIQPSLPYFYRFFVLSFFLGVSVLSWIQPSITISSSGRRAKCVHNHRPFPTLRIMSFSESDDDYTLEGLEKYAETLISANRDLEESLKASVCIAVAGGGGHAISTLAATSGASSLLLEGTVAYDRRSYQKYVGLTPNSTRIKSNSLDAAALASEAALKRAMSFRAHNLKQMNGCIGVGCASALVSSSAPKSVKGSGFIVATRADGSQLSINVSLGGKSNKSRRTRKEEDIFISHLVLRSIELILQAERGKKESGKIETDAGDLITEEWGTSLPHDGIEEDVAFSAAQRLLDGDEQALVLLPVYKEGRPVSFRALKYPVIANGSLVMPGSFNPPHKGHISLGQAGVRAAVRMGYSKRHDEKPIFMELSLTNADKPPIDPATAAERVHKFLRLEDLPEQWGVVMTRAPLFSQKVACLQNCVADDVGENSHKISFVIGADTLVRILNPKYYNDDKEQMIDALLSMEGTHFFAGGRVEQKKDSPEPVRFITGKEELGGLPAELKEKFTIIEEQEFRVDISSTEIRNKETERLAGSQNEQTSTR